MSGVNYPLRISVGIASKSKMGCRLRVHVEWGEGYLSHRGFTRLKTHYRNSNFNVLEISDDGEFRFPTVCCYMLPYRTMDGNFICSACRNEVPEGFLKTIVRGTREEGWLRILELIGLNLYDATVLGAAIDQQVELFMEREKKFMETGEIGYTNALYESVGKLNKTLKSLTDEIDGAYPRPLVRTNQ